MTTEKQMDRRWLVTELAKSSRMPTSAQADDFFERVSIIIADGCVNLKTARELALKELKNG